MEGNFLPESQFWALPEGKPVVKTDKGEHVRLETGEEFSAGRDCQMYWANAGDLWFVSPKGTRHFWRHHKA